MASQSLPIPVPQTKAWVRAGARAINRTLPLWTVVAILAALLILFGWLHLILALEVTSTNRAIQERTAVLDRIERDQAIIVREIAAARSPQRLEDRALQGGFQTHRPLYLIIEPGLAETDPGTGAEEGARTEASSSSSPSLPARSTLLEAVVTEADSWPGSETTP
jgi:hypothetical protein